MHEAYNYYVGKVLDAMVRMEIPLDRAKQICRRRIKRLERHYYRLDNFEVAAAKLLVAKK